MTKPAVTLQDLYDGQQLLIRLFNGLDSRVANLESRMESLSVKVESLDNKVDKLDAKVEGLGRDLSKLRAYTEAGFDTLNDRFDRLEARMDGFEGRGGLLRLAVS